MNVNWRNWDGDAFEEARSSGKPVLLSISATWCHWCHVMDNETYSEEQVAQLVNNDFIPVRVDSDRNPEINSRFNMGGWPTTAFLTPDRQLMAGTTYVPAHDMVSMLERVRDIYARDRDEIHNTAHQRKSEFEQKATSVEPGDVGVEDIDAVRKSMQDGFDSEYGGFGTEQKFPCVDSLEFLLADYVANHNEESLRMVVETVDAMDHGDMFDGVEGGMFRYATQRNWRVPHFEKMLEDNSQMSWLLLELYRITGEEKFRKLAEMIFSYMENTLLDGETGAFYGSQDADEEYYLQIADNRKDMRPPSVDKAIFTDWNAKLVRSYIKLWAHGHDSTARDKAVRITYFLNKMDKAPDGTMPHYYEDGRVHKYGYLSDTVDTMFANIWCYEATGDEYHIEEAKSLALALDNFRSASCGLYDISVATSREEKITRALMPLSENCRAATALMKLSAITGEGNFALSAKQILRAQKEQYNTYGILAGEFGKAMIFSVHEPVVINVTLAMDYDDAENDTFLWDVIKRSNPLCTMRMVANDEANEAVVCAGESCFGRATTPEEIPSLLAEAEKASAR